MDSAPFFIRHWELLMITVFGLGAIEMAIAWKLGLHRSRAISNVDVLMGAAVCAGAITLFGGIALILWIFAGVISSMPGW